MTKLTLSEEGITAYDLALQAKRVLYSPNGRSATFVTTASLMCAAITRHSWA
jgi:hypothetical protein